MSLTPKDWKKFQHYVDRRPPWIKLHRAILDDVQFQRLPVDSRALAPMLWLYAAEYDGGTITETWSDISFRLRMTLDEFTRAVGPLISKGFFVSSGDADEALAPREQNGAPEREEEAEKERETETRPVASDRPVKTVSRFEEFWRAYPRRDGDNPRKPAEKKFDGLVKTGLDPEMLISAVKQYATANAAKVGTPYIPQAVTWLNQQRWSDHAAVAAVAAIQAPSMSLETAVAQYAKLGIWSRHAPCGEPGTASCTAPAELLAKYGLDPIGRKLPPRDLPDEPLEAA